MFKEKLLRKFFKTLYTWNKEMKNEKIKKRKNVSRERI